MEEQTDKLLKSLEQYETQLAQVRKQIQSTSSNGDNQDLYSLEKDIEELISLTKETLSSLKQSSFEDSNSSLETHSDALCDEYALFKSELAELEEKSALKHEDKEDFKTCYDPTEDIGLNGVLQELKEDLNTLKGSKCQAPYKNQWGDESFYNALIVDIETNDSIEDIHHILVKVLYVNPTAKDMLPCPYYLDGECKFADDKCYYSHGELVPLANIREYREPDFSLIKQGSQVLAKQNDNLWHRAKVEGIINDNQCLVKFESKGCETVELDLHDLLPLTNERQYENESSTDESDKEYFAPQEEYFVQLSLMNTPVGALGAWEKHTKGIGSRLMANMGYIVGCGLGKYGEGRLEPVEAMAYPPGKSLDACMALKEAAGRDKNIFKAEKRQKKQQRKLLRLQNQQQLRQTQKKDVFSFINSQISGVAGVPPESSHQPSLASSSRKGLNVERFRLGENIKKVQKDITKFKETLKRHDSGSITHKTVISKLNEAQTELKRLQKSDSLVAREQDHRDSKKKMVHF